MECTDTGRLNGNCRIFHTMLCSCTYIRSLRNWGERAPESEDRQHRRGNIYRSSRPCLRPQRAKRIKGVANHKIQAAARVGVSFFIVGRIFRSRNVFFPRFSFLKGLSCYLPHGRVTQGLCCRRLLALYTDGWAPLLATIVVRCRVQHSATGVCCSFRGSLI